MVHSSFSDAGSHGRWRYLTKLTKPLIIFLSFIYTEEPIQNFTLADFTSWGKQDTPDFFLKKHLRRWTKEHWDRAAVIFGLPQQCWALCISHIYKLSSTSYRAASSPSQLTDQTLRRTTMRKFEVRNRKFQCVAVRANILGSDDLWLILKSYFIYP